MVALRLTASLYHRNTDAVTRRTSSSSMEDWDNPRKLLYDALQKEIFHVPVINGFIALVVFANMFVLAYEVDLGADCVSTGACDLPEWLRYINRLFIVIYAGEVVARLYVERVMYWKSVWNIIDVFVLLIGIIDLVLEGLLPDLRQVSLLRLFRVIRMLRSMKIIRCVPTFWALIRSFMGAVKVVSSAISLLAVLLLVWSIIGVEVIHPVSWHIFNHDIEDLECRDAMSNIFNAFLYLFTTLVVGDDWSRCSVPIIKRNPFAIVFFTLAMLSIQLGFLNLVLAVIVDKTIEAREISNDERVRGLFQDLQDTICDMDADEDGKLTRDEIKAAKEKNPAVSRKLKDVGIAADELVSLFDIMDKNNDGALSTRDFINSLMTAHTQHPQLHNMTTQLRLEHLQHEVARSEQDLNKCLDAHLLHFRHEISNLDARLQRHLGMPERQLDLNAAHELAAKALSDKVNQLSGDLTHFRGWVDRHSEELKRSLMSKEVQASEAEPPKTLDEVLLKDAPRASPPMDDRAPDGGPRLPGADGHSHADAGWRAAGQAVSPVAGGPVAAAAGSAAGTSHMPGPMAPQEPAAAKPYPGIHL